MADSRCPKMDRHLEMLTHRKDGGLCMVASCLTGYSWRGSVWIFDNPANAPDSQAVTAWAHAQSGNTDVVWLDARRVLTAADDGSVRVWELSRENKALKLARRLTEHDDTVQTISVAADGLGIVSGGWDCR
jgi:methylosome protein 50